MSTPREEASLSPQATASPAALEREVRELRAVNRILAQKVVELEDLVAELKKARETDPKQSSVSTSL